MAFFLHCHLSFGLLKEDGLLNDLSSSFFAIVSKNRSRVFLENVILYYQPLIADLHCHCLKFQIYIIKKFIFEWSFYTCSFRANVFPDELYFRNIP